MTGKITQISGSVIDVRFDADHMPRIKEALSVTVDGHKRVMEVAQHIGNKEVRCIMLTGSEGMARGMDVEATGKTIQVPVGEVLLLHRAPWQTL